MNSVNVVTAYRYANRNSHTYIVGVFTFPEDAIYSAELEEDDRSGKYYCEVVQLDLNRHKTKKTIIRPLEEF